MQITLEHAIHTYADVYQRVYKRAPRNVHILDSEWVMINGARMRINELEYLTEQLEHEYSKLLAQKRSLVNRLINWFK